MKASVIVLGDTNVGKTSLISQLVWHNLPIREYPTTEFKDWYCSGKWDCTVTAFLRDTPGLTRNIDHPVDQIMIRGRQINGALIVYDIHNRQSYEAAKEWVLNLKPYVNENYSRGISIALVGNKVDVANGRVVSTSEAKEYAKQHELIFMETSAKTQLNVNEVFGKLVNLVTFADMTKCLKEIEEFEESRQFHHH